ncbi:MAG TPA: ATP-dependent DNA helicase RecG [Fimbriimonadaceae bacterium]|nr:ATP-dependent DNA helicase RecG [Fimbriimonadaceae bacterium]
MATRDPLDTEVQFLKGIGPKLAELLGKAGLRTVRDVLYYIPRRYEDRTNTPPIASVRPGQWVTLRGKVSHVEARPTSRGMVILRVMLTDGKGGIALIWFNQPWLKKKLLDYKGEMIVYGQVKEGSNLYEINSPEFELLEDGDEVESFARIVPVYALVNGVNQNLVRRAVQSALNIYLPQVQDPFFPALLRRYELDDIQWCLRQIHEPESDDARLRARKRLVFEEFLITQLALALRRGETLAEIGIPYQVNRKDLESQIHSIFPFELTGAQKRVVSEIWADMERPSPMSRLVQGDVGSGKTAVAACAILAAVQNGYQAVMMAPTEILAEQHYRNLAKMFEPLGLDVELLVGKLTPTAKKKAYERTASGVAHIAVGTHAIIQEGVSFKSLGLVIIDEQHRFGVLQRAALRDKGFGNPDVLVMSATPIPRTLTMALYGDLDLSVIDELPPGRKPIKTHWRRSEDRLQVYEGVREMVKEGMQAYFVCPMVAENEEVQAQAAEDLHYRLSTGVFVDCRVGLLHGQMKSKDKEAVMEQFRAHELDILVSTTVIEVGVDVPNANIMVIEDANRFGLSQLHQLRGRVGRGGDQSFCILIAEGKTDEARARLETMVETTDGFKIAEVDLRLRGPGELAGTKQSGNIDFHIADLVQDGALMEVAREAAMKIVQSDPSLSRPENQRLKLLATQVRGSQLQATVS